MSLSLLGNLAAKYAIFGASTLLLTYGTPLIDWPHHPKTMKTVGALMGGASAVIWIVHAEKLFEVSQLAHTWKVARLKSAKQRIVTRVVESVVTQDPFASVREMLENTFKLGDITAHPELNHPELPRAENPELVPVAAGPDRPQPADEDDSFEAIAHRFIDYLAPRLMKLGDADGWMELEKLRANWGKDNGLPSKASMEAFLDRLAQAQVGEWHPKSDSLWRLL